MDRKKFLQQTTGVAAGTLLIPGALKAAFSPSVKPMRVAMVGTGHRGLGMWENRW